MKSVCVFCGSSPGLEEIYEKTAYETGKEIASRNFELVYGGSTLGLMGAVAKGAIDGDGKVIAVMPEFFQEIVEQPQLHKIILAKDMHQRKKVMYDRSDLFMVLPGGLGTLEEGLEVLTWCQLGLISKPVGFLNVNGFYNDLLEMFSMSCRSGFIRKEHVEIVVISATPSTLLDKLIDHKIPKLKKWLDKNGKVKHI